MNKKRILIVDALFIILIGMILLYCGSSQIFPRKRSTYIEKFLLANSMNIQCEIKRKTVTNLCWFEYPVISGMEDMEKQQQINDYIYCTFVEPYLTSEQLISYMETYGNHDPFNWNELTYTIDCEIKLCNDSIMSVVFRTFHMWSGSPIKNRYVFALNFDLETGQQIDPQFRYDMKDSFWIELIQKSNWKYPEGKELKRILTIAQDEPKTLLTLLKPYNSGISKCFYFTQQKLGYENITGALDLLIMEAPYENLTAWEIN